MYKFTPTVMTSYFIKIDRRRHAISYIKCELYIISHYQSTYLTPRSERPDFRTTDVNGLHT